MPDHDKPKQFKDEKLKEMERKGEIKFEVVTNDSTDRSLILLTGAKNIFQKQLPKMPKEYITRLVYDKKHATLLITKNANAFQVIGAITYRAFVEKRFVEIVFCAISSDEQVQGYGSFLMNRLKEHVKTLGDVVYFLTYADNYAVGYFKKQGFTKEITFPRDIWGGCIKDYDGGTLMLCTMLPKVNYNEVFCILDQQRQAIIARITNFISEPQIRPGIGPLLEASMQKNTILEPEEVPGVLEAGWTPEMRNISTEKKSKIYEVLRPFIVELQNHPSSWPFLQPVNRNEVPEYYEVIKTPMDFSQIEDKIEAEQYASLDDFVADVSLVFVNCKSFNDPSTQYYKCAERLEEFFRKRLSLLKPL